MNIKLYENILSVDDFLYIHKEMGYELEPREQVELALTKSLYTVLVKDNNDIVGMGRLVGDGAMYFYIQDVRVLPHYQNKGIGKAIINKLIDFVHQNGISQTSISIGLFSAKGKESFYEGLGFNRQPCEEMGHGMCKEINICLK